MVRLLRDRFAVLNDRLAVGECRSDRSLIFERYGDRREVGLGPADPLGKSLEAIAVRLALDRVLGVEVRLLPGPSQRDIGAFPGRLG